MNDFNAFNTHIYYIDDIDALPKLAEFVSKQLDALIPVDPTTDYATALFNQDESIAAHFQLWTMVEPGIASEMDIVLQLGHMLEDTGVLTKEGDYYAIISASWHNHKFEQERLVCEVQFNPTPDWFPIVVGLFSPIVSAGVNSALVRLGL